MTRCQTEQVCDSVMILGSGPGTGSGTVARPDMPIIAVEPDPMRHRPVR